MRAPHKYRAVAVTGCTGCGGKHPSKREAKRCGELHLLQRAGVITDLRSQAAFPLFGKSGPLVAQPTKTGARGRQLRMTWDFAYTDTDGQVVEDSKGVKTTDFQLRRSVFEACYPEIRTVLS